MNTIPCRVYKVLDWNKESFNLHCIRACFKALQFMLINMAVSKRTVQSNDINYIVIYKHNYHCSIAADICTLNLFYPTYDARTLNDRFRVYTVHNTQSISKRSCVIIYTHTHTQEH